jgi:adenosylmethionine-8-amino-7-oxononanoate aminotransferase
VRERIEKIGAIQRERLEAIRDHAAVGDVRTIGSVAAIELRAEDEGYSSQLRLKLYRFFLDRGVLLRPLGHIIYVLPPYAISASDLHFIHDQIGEALQSV